MEKFEALLRSDEGLQERLGAAAEAYAGDAADARAAFDAVVAPLAAEAGLPFTYDEAIEYADGDREVSLDEADGAAGGQDVPSNGYGICLVVGFGEVDADACKRSSDAANDMEGAGACASIGVGFIAWN